MEAPRFIAWRSSDRYHLVLVAVLVFVLAAVLTLLNVVYAVHRVDGPSMSPALEDDDRVLVTRGYGTPHAGDVIAFRMLDQDGVQTNLLKRVIAVPGDSVEIVGDVAYVNGVLSSVAPTAQVGTDAETIGPFIVPDGTVYVLGDNRPISLDSRFFGPVALDSVIGKGVMVVLPISRARRIDG